MKSSPAGRLMLWLSLFCFPFVFSYTAAAQDKDWRPVTPEELASKAPIVEPDADAEAIFWEVRIDDSSAEKFIRRTYVRVKIYTERGREKFSKVDVPFYKGLKIKDLAARVIRSDGSIVDVKNDDIFEREIVKANGVKVKAKSFAVPNIEPGVIVEYRYREVYSEDISFGARLPFQLDIPVQRLSYYFKPFNSESPAYQSYNFTEPTKFIKDKDGYWLAQKTDVPSYKEEPKMPPEDEVRPWMLITNIKINIPDMGITISAKEPGSPSKYWSSVGYSNSEFVKFMNKESGDIKKAANEITAGAANDDQKLRLLYEFCQNKINNLSYDASLTDEQREKLPTTKSVADVLKRKAGKALYVDMLFGAMASALGFESRLAWAGDRSKKFFTPEMTNEGLVHRAAVAVKVNNDWRFFNPALPFLPYGSLIWWEEDTWALLVGEKFYEWKKTPYSDYASSALDRKGKLSLSEDGTLEGDISVQMTGQPALDFRLDNYDETGTKIEQNVVEDVKRQISAAEVSNVVIENLKDGSKPLIQKYHVRVPNYAQKTGKRLFLQPGYFRYGVGADFSSSTRKYDIFFKYPWSENDEIEIVYPASFDLDNADAPADVADPRKIGELSVRMTADRPHSILKYSRKFHFGGGGNVLFGSQMYTPLKNMFDAFHTADSHTVTLKQK